MTIPLAACLATAAAQGPARGTSALTPGVLGSPITLEDGPDYTRFLECATRLLHPDFLHHDNQGALVNPLKKAAVNRTAVIAGHGHPGQVCTSNGIDCVLPDQSINASNHLSWKAWAGAWPGRFHSLTILSCDVGNGPDGVKLLKLLADEAGIPVRAPTDFIWCDRDKIVLDENAEWQEVSPTRVPTPIPFKPRSGAPMTPETDMQISVDGAIRKAPFGAAKLDSFYVLGAQKPDFSELAPAAVPSLLEKINFAEPFVTSYVPDADVTSRFELQIDIDQRSLHKRFVVLNDRLVNDVDDRRVYYRTSSSFTEQLQSLRRR